MSGLGRFDRARCRSCAAPIVWAVTTAHRRMPLDPTPDPAGNVVMTAAIETDDDGRLLPVVRVLHDGDTHYGDRYRPHFATCPRAADHRSRP